jgi:hypothetical protein
VVVCRLGVRKLWARNRRFSSHRADNRLHFRGPIYKSYRVVLVFSYESYGTIRTVHGEQTEYSLISASIMGRSYNGLHTRRYEGFIGHFDTYIYMNWYCKPPRASGRSVLAIRYVSDILVMSTALQQLRYASGEVHNCKVCVAAFNFRTGRDTLYPRLYNTPSNDARGVFNNDIQCPAFRLITPK